MDQTYEAYCIRFRFRFQDILILVFNKKAKELPVYDSSVDTFTDSLGTTMFKNCTYKHL